MYNTIHFLENFCSSIILTEQKGMNRSTEASRHMQNCTK